MIAHQEIDVSKQYLLNKSKHGSLALAIDTRRQLISSQYRKQLDELPMSSHSAALLAHTVQEARIAAHSIV